MNPTTLLLATALAHTPLLADSIGLTPISTVRNGIAADLFDQSAAEIVKFDPISKRMFVVNGATDSIDIFDASNPSTPTLITSVDLSSYGNPNSVDVNPLSKSNEVAVALGAHQKDQRGKVVFLNKDGVILDSVAVGYLPDMLTYSSGGKLLVANEGEPTDDYAFDPEGSVSIIESKKGRRSHLEITFSHLAPQDIPGVRITGPTGTTVAQDLEPEFIAIEGSFAYVTCQENNAVAKIDITKNRLVAIFPLGSINHAELGNAFDASDRDNMIRIANWPVHGLFMPDSIATYTTSKSKGKRATYFVTANEGDAREWGDYSDEARIRTLSLDPSAFPLAVELKKDLNLGRLSAITTEGDIDGDGDYDQLFSYGTRSFSIFDENGKLVYNSGAMIEAYLAENFPDDFNSAHDESDSFDSRSDAKGAEPEAIEIGVLNGRTYAFVGLERFSGILVCDITNPLDVQIAGFGLNRDFSVAFDEDNLDDFAAAGDLGPEGLDFVAADKSPNGQPLLIVANEVSGTTTIYQISTLAD